MSKKVQVNKCLWDDYTARTTEGSSREVAVIFGVASHNQDYLLECVAIPNLDSEQFASSSASQEVTKLVEDFFDDVDQTHAESIGTDRWHLDCWLHLECRPRKRQGCRKCHQQTSALAEEHR